MSYGIAMHLGTTRNEWLPDGSRPALADRTAYRASIGPSIMLRGITANGRLTSVRVPVSLTAEKTLGGDMRASEVLITTGGR